MSKGFSNREVILGLFWRFAERSGAQIVSLIVSIILARLLTPDAYGMIALVSIFITIFQVFIDGGFGNALIQKKHADDLDFSTVFFFNIFVCCILYIFIFMIAPWISRFYNNAELIHVIRVLGLVLIISGLKNVQQAYVSRNMLFKKFFFSTLIGTVVAAVIGIFMAYNGAGVWALVVQHLTNVFVDTCILWFTVKWHPKLMFSFERLKKLFNFGWKLLMSTLLNQVYQQLWQLIIGKVYSPINLAYYNQGEKFPKVIITNINSSIDSVLLPTMSNIQDDKERLKAYTRRAITISTYIISPLMIGLCFVAVPVISLLLTEKWLLCVPYLRIFCIIYMFYPIHTANLNAITALGRTDICLKLEVIKKIVGFSALLVTMNFGMLAMAYGLLFTSFASQVINSWPNKKLLNYSYVEQIKDILPIIGLAFGMGCIINIINYFEILNLIKLLIQILMGGIIYLLGSCLLKIESFKYLLNILTTMKNRK